MLVSLLQRGPALAAGRRSFSLLSKYSPAFRLGVARPTTSFYAQTLSRRAFLTTTPALATVKDAPATAAKPKTKPKAKPKAAGAKKPAAAGTKKKTTARKAAAKKTSPKKKKVVLKKRPIVKKKKRVEKPKPKRITKKELTPPFKGPGNAWTAFVMEFMGGKDFVPREGSRDFIEANRQAAGVWKTMSDEEKQKYSPDRAVVEAFIAKRRAWVRSLEPRLRRAYHKHHKKGYTAQGRTTVFCLFTQDMWKQLPTGIPFKEKNQVIADRYKDLTEADKEILKIRVMKINEERAAASASGTASDSGSSQVSA